MAFAQRRQVTLPVAILFLLAASCGRKDEAADLAIRNTSIYTARRGDSAVISHGAIAIAGSRIVYVGEDKGVAAFIGDRTEVIDGAGGLVTPGFIDSHVHPNSGVELMECDLSEDATPSQVLASVRRCAEARPGAPWVRGTGWRLPAFPQANPTAALLDQVVPDRPAFLVAADGHSAWINSRAMVLAGLSADTRDPPNGRIERDASGVPSGTLRESAMQLVSRLLPPYTVEDYVAGFRQAFDLATSRGITAMVDANADSLMLEAYRWMDSSGSLPVRITAAQDLGPGPSAAVVPRVLRWRDRFQGPLLNANSAKIFLDGVIEARTAALLADYLDRPGSRGEPRLTQLALDSLVTALARAGIQVHVHAIGDRAIRMALDAFERTRSPGRHQIAHLELIDPADIPRFQALGVIANFQPFWASDDSYIVNLTIPALGPERSRWLYPIRSVVETGATVVAGSDWSVSSMNPLEAIQIGTTRRALDTSSGEGWIPEERATVAQLLAAYTINGAYGRFADGSTGSLEVGKLADLVLLEKNILAIPPDQIGTTGVALTMMDGRVRYRRDTHR